MLLSATTLALALFAPVATSKLLGSSFGIAGTNASFDYVVVGGGNAGNVIAARLSQAGHSVALVEAGTFYELTGNTSVVPQYDFNYMFTPTSPPNPVDWNINTLPQPGLNGRVIHYTQGKTFGGATALNYMAYHRPTVGSAEKWAETVGDSSYTWNNTLPYYKKSITFTPPDLAKIGDDFPEGYFDYDTTAFGNGGPLNITYANYQQPYGVSLAQGYDNIGINHIDGLNSGELIGYAPLTVAIDNRDATRSSSETSFLRLAIDTTSLLVYQQTLARRILFDSAKKATGVVVETTGAPGVLYTLTATKEVISCAGAFRSPQLLMVSGIGPASTLQGLGIEVLSDLPGVGQGLSDQPVLGLSYEVNTTTNYKLLVDPEFAATETQAYLESQTGPLSSVGGDIVGWEKLPQKYRANMTNETVAFLDSFPSDWPELELLALAVGAPSANASATDNFLSLNLAILTYKSLGNVTINSTDTNDNPLVSPNWLQDPIDQDIAVQGFKRIREWAAASPGVGQETSPGPSVQTDAQILEWVKNTGSLIYHSSAGCKMGAANDTTAVVDTQGNVRGVSGLRVIDSSILPFLTPGHPTSVVYMISEKIVDQILGQKMRKHDDEPNVQIPKHEVHDEL